MLKAFPNSGPNIISTASTTIATKTRIKIYSIKACPCSPAARVISPCFILSLHSPSAHERHSWVVYPLVHWVEHQCLPLAYPMIWDTPGENWWRFREESAMKEPKESCGDFP